jgi:hypothetical protein
MRSSVIAESDGHPVAQARNKPRLITDAGSNKLAMAGDQAVRLR